MKLKLAILLTLFSIGIHTYLALHYYDLNYGGAVANSVCNLNSTFNCDSVAASKYSSFMNIPMAVWGAATNLMLLILLLGWLLRWSNDVPRLARYSFWMSLGIVAASVVMGTISLTDMNVYCIFCMAAYVLSFATAFLLKDGEKEDARPNSQYVRELFTSARVYLVFILGIPLFAYLVNNSVVSKEGPKRLERFVKQAVADFTAAPAATFSAPGLMKGATDENAKVTLVEFADFRCIHCRNAATAVTAFLSTRPEVQFRFHFFPLDGACNDSVNFNNGISCVLAKAVTCAEEVGQKGWPMHDRLFADQPHFNAGGVTVDSTKAKVAEYASALQVDGDAFKKCLDSSEVHERIKKMAKEGADAGVAGTPSFYMNGKRIDGGQLLPVLEAVYNEAIRQKR